MGETLIGEYGLPGALVLVIIMLVGWVRHVTSNADCVVFKRQLSERITGLEEKVDHLTDGDMPRADDAINALERTVGKQGELIGRLEERVQGLQRQLANPGPGHNSRR